MFANPRIGEDTNVCQISEVVDSVPGWVHDVTNIGNDEMVVLVWANENFDRKNPDTNALKVLQ